MEFQEAFDKAMERSGREVSTIAFPYVDLDEAIKVADAIFRKGGVPLERDQISAELNTAGGTLSNKLSAAKQFGLIDSQQGRWSLTPLGYEILDAGRTSGARAEAFLNVELYRRAYDEYRGKLLPSPAGLEHAFTTFGVAVKQKQKARQTFERSARAAGYFPAGREDRLVAPVVAPTNSREPEAAEQEVGPAPGSPTAWQRQPVAPGMHPFVEGLLSELPEARSEWSMEDRAKWLQAAAQIFDLIYSGGRGRITVLADG